MQATTTPRVLAVLVAHDGEPWLARTLAALDAQTYPELDVVAVDNGSTDGSRRLLTEHLGEDRVLVAERDLGFGAAVSMALDARAAGDAPYVLLLHDDAALAPDAVAHLVAALEQDPRLAIVGPKLRDWHDPRRLQSVGWTVDLTGRADSGIDEGELDQGQRDQERRTLYVSTCGMLLRREVFDRLGRFDRHFHLFRDDLDLCWRAWLAGHDVEVVPDAVASHVAGATNYIRLGQTRFLGPRYFAERNTLATLLKNYGAARLLVVVPLYFVVGLAKVAGFLLTRRVSDAWQTVRAWLWNGYHLRRTWRLRRQVQSNRQRTDGEIRELFGKIAPRVRAYAEAIAEWIAGGDTPLPDRGPDDVSPEPRSATRRAVELVRRRPVLVAAGILTLVGLVAALPLLAPGTLRGGQLAPWPASPRAFLGDYVSGWHDAGAFGTSQPPSPAQAILGLLQVVTFGSAYLASRLLLFAAAPVAWILALRAAQGYSDRRVARVAAASAYVLSPPAFAALVTGEVGALVVFAVLPGLVAAGTVLVRPTSPPQRAWRAVAAVVLLGAIGGAFEPVLILFVAAVAVLAGAVGALNTTDAGWRQALLARVGIAGAGPFVLLLPWSASILAADGPLRGAVHEPVVTELWRWVALAPDVAGFPGLLAGVGFVAAGLLGLALGLPQQIRLVGGLWAAALGGAVLAWLVGRTGSVAWAGLPLLLTAASYAGLLAVGVATAERRLARYAFGWRQLALAGTATAVLVSVGTVAVTLVQGPWEHYRVGGEILPGFVAAAHTDAEPFRVLLLADTADGVQWEVVPGGGPTMAGYGVPEAGVVQDRLQTIVEDLVSGTDPGAAARLGVLNIHYIVVPSGGESDRLDESLRTQVGVEPRPVAAGRVLGVTSAMPRVAVVPETAAQEIALRGEPPRDTQAFGLLRGDEDVYATEGAPAGRILVAEVADPGWRATALGQALTPQAGELTAFVQPEPGADVRVWHDAGPRRILVVAAQILLVLLAISLALRPPRFARGLPEEEPASLLPQPAAAGVEDQRP